MLLSQNLKTLRRSINWTQRETSASLGIPLGRYQSYEEARAEPGVCMLIKLSKLFNVTIDQLVSKKMKMRVEADGKGL